VLKIPQKISLKFAKRSKKLPIVLSREEIKNIIKAIRNPNNYLFESERGGKLTKRTAQKTFKNAIWKATQKFCEIFWQALAIQLIGRQYCELAYLRYLLICGRR